MARAQGVEPQPTEPESVVLPLDNARMLLFLRGYDRFWLNRCQAQVPVATIPFNARSDLIFYNRLTIWNLLYEGDCGTS